MAHLQAGGSPPTQLYSELYQQLYKLSDTQIREAYCEYGQLYVAEDTP